MTEDLQRPCEHEALPDEWAIRHGELLHAYRDLRAAIEQHRADMWDRLLGGPSDDPADARLYAALEDNDG